jgi:DNA-binding response OmpR family regulator
MSPPVADEKRDKLGGEFIALSRCRRLLLVEDDPQLRRSLTRAFSRDGWQIVAAADLGAARKASGRFSAGVFDLALPDGDGAMLAVELMQQQRVQHCLFFTALPEGPLRAAAARLGSVITKCSGLQSLRETLRAVTCGSIAPSGICVERQPLHQSDGPLVLLISEESKQAFSVLPWAQQHGYTLHHAPALDVDDISRVSPDLIVLFEGGAVDIACCQRIRENAVDAHLIYVAMSACVQACKDALRAGADAFIARPLDPELLLLKAEALLRRPLPPRLVCIGPVTVMRRMRRVWVNDMEKHLRRSGVAVLLFVRSTRSFRAARRARSVRFAAQSVPERHSHANSAAQGRAGRRRGPHQRSARSRLCDPLIARSRNLLAGRLLQPRTVTAM